MAKDQTSFFRDVYEVTKLIPRGRATSYGAIAAYLGTKGSARIVGYAMNGAHNDPDVPAHRVVNRQGLLTGKHHFNPPAAMQERLEAEGVKVIKDQIQNFKSVYWDPNIELAL
jgi:methylated-DNA-protein-cysteine methyltransferase-like protein